MKTRCKKVLSSFILMAVLTLVLSPLVSNVNALPARSASRDDTVILHAIDYFKAQQNDDGGIRWTDDTSSVAVSIRVLLALSAAGLPQTLLISPLGLTPIDFLAEQSHDWLFQIDSEEPQLNLARAGQLLAAVAAADQDPYAFGSEALNLPHLIKRYYDPNTGVFGNATQDNVTDQVWAILGLTSAYAAVPQDSLTWLAQAQQADGSWDDGFGSTLDTTPLAIMALLSTGEKHANDPEIQLALDFFKENQRSDGGWQSEWDSTTSASLTGMILQSLYAAGINPDDTAWTGGDGTPQTALLEIQQENGAFGGDFINAYGTADALLGLSDQPFYDLSLLRRIGRAYESIFSIQGEDGGWGSPGQTIDVILAASAGGWDPESIAQSGQSPFSFLVDHLDEYLESGPDAIGKTVLALAAAGRNPETINGVDLVEALNKTYTPEYKAFGDPDNTWHQALSILALKAANAEIPQEAIQTLLNLQQDDGGWEYSAGFGTWPDNTSLALQALSAAGLKNNDDAIQNGLAYFRSLQQENGGWGDSSTSAFVIMALNALALNLDDWQTDTHRSPIQDLLTYQNASGAFRFSEDFSDDNLMATTAAILALIGGHYQIDPVEQVSDKAIGLVIQADLETITTACVSIDGDSASGLALLSASGIPHESQDGFINGIMERSNPKDGTLYWSYWHWDGREYSFYSTGAGDTVVFLGSIEAWYLTSWEQFPSLPPEYVPHLNTICGTNPLKNYTAQPYLGYYDLNHSVAKVNQSMKFTVQTYTQDAESSVKAAESKSEALSTTPIINAESSAKATESKSETLSTTPIIIIAVLGVLVVALIIWLLIKRK